MNRDHPSVSQDLGQNRGGRNGLGQRIAVNDCLLWNACSQRETAINQQKVRLPLQGEDGREHRLQRGVVDVDLVDLLRTDGGNRPVKRNGGNLWEKTLTSARRQFFGIVNPGDQKTGWQDHCSSKDRTGQATSPNLIDTNDLQETATIEVVFKLKGRLSSFLPQSPLPPRQYATFFRKGFSNSRASSAGPCRD